MIGFFRLIVLIAGVIGGVSYFIKNILSTNQWRKGISQTDRNLLKEALLQSNQNLVELDQEELMLLSFNREHNTVRTNGKKIKTGVFYSIYNEPLLNYALIEKDRFNKIILVSTSEQDYIYRVGQKSTDIYCNDNLIGALDNKGDLIAPVSQQTLMTIENDKETKYQRVEKGGKEVAAVLNPLLVDSTNQRVIQYEELDNDVDRTVALSLIFLNMIERL